ncbi:MAG TPA: translation initiation factor [Phycisphaerae bacterium]|nr:translation initiation factor [Phycisphaerae bacterium]
MAGLFDGTPLERPVTCSHCNEPMDACACPRDASGEVLLAKDQPVRIRVEKRKKGKHVTVISGIDPVASDLATILKKLKNACAAGGTISDGAIEIQGDHADRVQKELDGLGFRSRIVR